ncbi:hypothetical protein F7725_013495 [Dissostichus mawsoni]|uniref:Uncharacterized protein n=1 Tax=Dissostichus mawsoni TaxID=36200 RepID=A0A7J5YRF4_DISMA|nr:hypothetical protein F7725_013495 [Dissostichus mawsoni]
MLNNPKKPAAAASGTHSTKRNGQRKAEKSKQKAPKKKKSHNRQKTCGFHKEYLCYIKDWRRNVHFRSLHGLVSEQ